MVHLSHQHLSIVVVLLQLLARSIHYGGGFYSYFLWTSVGITTIEARDVIKVILNDGIMPTIDGDYCNEQDILLIDAAISGDTNTNGDDEDDEDEADEDDRRSRHLVATNLTTSITDRTKFVNDTIHDTSHIPARDLSTYSKKCANYCRGYAIGTCRATKCLGYRRQRQLRTETQPQRNDEQRRLNICDANIERVTMELLNVETQVSTSCQKILQRSKRITCFDEAEYAMIEGFTLWNTETKSIVQENMANNMTICISNTTTATPRYNIEAIPNACVEVVQMRLTGPNMSLLKLRVEGPYTIFGSPTNSNGDYNALYGRRLPVGTYQVTTELSNSMFPIKQLQFHVKKC